MTEEEKKRLIDAVNSWGNNITEIYYKIGRAVPFTAQRFPDGRDSSWYRSQYVQVVEVKPHGHYGKAYGFYYRNGERADSSDIESICWCRKDDKEPQEIPNSGCGGWRLLDIQGEPSKEFKLWRLEDVLDFGKYEGHTIKDVARTDWEYLEWAVYKAHKLFVDVNELESYHAFPDPGLKPTDIMPLGKYKGQTLGYVYANDVKYLAWLERNHEPFKVDWQSFHKPGEPTIENILSSNEAGDDINVNSFTWDWEN